MNDNKYTKVKTDILEKLKAAHKEHQLLAYGHAALNNRHSGIIDRGSSIFSTTFAAHFKVDESDGGVYHVNEADEFVHDADGKRLSVDAYFKARPDKLDQLR
jgi:hypothetical protein